MKYLILIMLFLVFFLSVKIWIKNFKIRRAGKRGETDTYRSIKSLARDRGYKIYRNLEIPLYEGKTEIDMLMVTGKELLVVENKNLNGKIQGSTNDEQWIQRKRSGEVKRFYNPIMQNEGHMKCLKHNLLKAGIKGVRMKSIIVFSHEGSEVCINDRRVTNIEGFETVLKNSSQRGHSEKIVKSINSFSLK